MGDRVRQQRERRREEAHVEVLTPKDLEERFGLTIEDDEIGGSTFATVGSLSDFVQAKLAG